MTLLIPASSANLGPGFDALAVALATYVEVGGPGPPAPEGHPAVVAFRRAGGQGPLSARESFPPGRGLGFSGAARVGGLLAAARQQGRSIAESRDDVLRVATELEGHAENAAASLLGGVVATAGGHAVRVPLALDPALLVWIPARGTSTRAARSRLPSSVPFADAVFNVGRTALLVAALAAGDVASLRAATEDRLHQDARLERVPGTRDALSAALAHGAWCAWLSGSGPSVVALAAPSTADAVAASLPAEGRVLRLAIDTVGAVEVDDGRSPPG